MRTNLKIFRIQQQLNQNEMAAKTGFERAYYGHIERGYMRGSSLFWDRLQEAFGLSDKAIEELKKNE